ncbi:MAG: carbohydrate ABC transporter permease [Oscillospiraceae bacterium]|nr:carbohydrate ABC transporter permease [Oscillospiraceae bacterium]
MSRPKNALSDKNTQSYKRSQRVKSIGMNIILIIITIFMLTPLLWMLSTAFSPNTLIPPAKLLPHDITFENFSRAWFFPKEIGLNDQLTMGTFLMNSLIVTIAITIGGIITDSLAAYVLAFKDFPGKNLLIFLALATLMIPSYVTLVPQYIIISKLKWLNSYQAQIVPFLASGMGITLFRSHFLSVSKELVESAKIDGASDFRIYSTIVMPIAKPIIATMTILKAMWSWNMYMWPLIVCKKVEMMPLQVSIGFFQGQNVTQWGLLCAGMTIAMLPLLIVFLLCQKFFVGGIQAGAVKG